MRDRHYFVCILASNSGVLYTGITNDLQRRVYEHRTGQVPGFTSWYRVHKLVWWERVEEPRAAITREKQLKAWSRHKRVALIEASNRSWLDLAADWFH